MYQSGAWLLNREGEETPYTHPVTIIPCRGDRDSCRKEKGL